MVNYEYLFVAENLIERNKNRLNENRDPKTQEVDDLFYWIMSRLEWCVQGCWPAKQSHTVKVEKYKQYDDGRILLKHGRVSEYLSEYIKGNEFQNVMEEVANIFNNIGKNEEKGYYYYAICFEGELIVHMLTD